MHAYLVHCIQLGILTSDPVTTHHITATHLSYVVKAYAIESHLPFEADADLLEAFKLERLYITAEGWEWLFTFFQTKAFHYLQLHFKSVFNLMKAEDVSDRNAIGYGAFLGRKRVFNKSGTGQRACVTHQKGNFKKRYEYDTLREAREAIFMLSRFYPISDFKLYRYAKTHNGYYPREVPIFKKGTPL
jgi:hypothetical protein